MKPRGRRWSITSKLVGLRKANAVKAAMPRCGAKNKRGGVCRNPGTGAGGKCPRHGGLTPSGRLWHVPVLPAGGPRLERKLAALAKRRKKRAAEVAAMTPERRARYDAWHATHAPGSPAKREMARRERETWQWLAQPPAPTEPNPRLAMLKAVQAELKKERERLEALLEQKPTQEKSRE